jgi:CRISPR-associated Csx2 family protein
MKIISFLGFNNYQTTTYVHPINPEITCKTRFFQEALVDFYRPAEIYVLLTKTVATVAPRGAEVTNWQGLQDCLADKVTIRPIEDIPEGSAPEDLWDIFDCITDCLDHGDRVIFDFTHGYRFLPVVALLAISYLRTVRQVQVEGVLYGAFDPNSQGESSPTYDLLPMLSLLDWLAATDRFVNLGDGLPLAQLLQTAIPGAERRDNPEVRNPGSRLDQAGKVIAEISQAIALARPMETLELTVQLEEIINRASDSFDQRAKPFNLIKDQLLAEYGQFALPESWEPENLQRNLWLQFQLINWYLQRGQAVQAMTLASEWLISVVAFRLGAKQILDHRKQINFALNNGGAVQKKREPVGPSSFDEQFQALSQYQFLSQLWNDLTEIRNDLAHCGMRKDPKSAKKLQEKANKIFPQLEEIANSLLKQ